MLMKSVNDAAVRIAQLEQAEAAITAHHDLPEMGWIEESIRTEIAQLEQIIHNAIERRQHGVC